MIKRSISVILITGLMLVNLASISYGEAILATAPQYDYALSNGNFTSGSSGWGGVSTSADGNASAAIITDGTEKYLEIKDSTTAYAVTVYSPMFTILPGAEDVPHYIEFRTKYVGAKASLGFRIYDATGAQISSATVSTFSQIYNSSTNWTANKLSFIPSKINTINDRTVRSIRVYLYTSSSTTGVDSFFDDFKMYTFPTKTLKTSIFTNVSGEVLSTLDSSVVGQNINSKADIIDTTNIEQPMTLLTGLYDKDNRMLDLVASNNSNALFGNTTLANSLAIPNDMSVSDHYVMSIIWNDIYGMRVLDNKVILSGSTSVPAAPATSIVIDGPQIDINGARLTVSGSVDNLNAGNKVTLTMLKFGKTSDDLRNLSDLSNIKDVVMYAYQTTADQNGKYSHSFFVDDNTLRGNYIIMVGGDGFPTNQVINKFFPGAYAAKNALDEINSSISVSAIKAIVENYAADFNWPLDRIIELQGNITPSGNEFVYEYLNSLAINYDTQQIENGMAELNRQFEIAIQLCKINFAPDTSQLKTLLGENASLLNMNLTEFNKVSDTDLRKIKFLDTLNGLYMPTVESLNNAFQENYAITFLNEPKDWNEMKNTVESVQTYVGIDMGTNSKYNKVIDKPKVFKKLLDERPFTSLEDIKQKFNTIVESLLVVRTTTVSSGGGGGGSVLKITPSVKTSMTVLKNSLSLLVDSSIAYVNGEKRSLENNNPNITAKVIEGRTLVPVRFLAENFGAKVDWDEAAETATITINSKVTKIKLNKNEITINNETVILDVPATTIDGRTMLPLRAFCEKVLGKVVFWDDRGLIVISDNTVLESGNDKNIIDNLVSMFK